MSRPFYIKEEANKSALRAHIELREPPFTVSIVDGVKRSTKQNALIHQWFGEIAAHRGDVTADQVKAECHLAYGVSIMAEDQEWVDAFGDIFAGLDYARKVELIRILDVPFTRRMKVKQLAAYMDAMQRDALSIGVRLTDPDELIWGVRT